MLIADQQLTVGGRIKALRQRKRWTGRFLADRAGVSPSTISRIERGIRGADNRFILAAIAAALECSQEDLTGQPYAPVDKALSLAQARALTLRRVLMDTDLLAPPEGEARPVEVLASSTDTVRALRRGCDYAGALALLPGLTHELHIAAHGPDRRRALELLLHTCYASTFTLRSLGHLAEAWIAAERCFEAAQELENPVALAVAMFARSHAAAQDGSYTRGLHLALRAIDDLGPHLAAPTALEVYGMLHLTAAFTTAGAANRAGRPVEGTAPLLDEADALAARTGETTSWHLDFGPTNVAIWRVGLAVDTGEGGRVREIGQRVQIDVVPSTSRKAAYYIDYGRGLAQVRGQADTALRMLLHAERMAPQHTRSSPAAREAARQLRAAAQRKATGSALRGLCERMGVPG